VYWAFPFSKASLAAVSQCGFNCDFYLPNDTNQFETSFPYKGSSFGVNSVKTSPLTLWQNKQKSLSLAIFNARPGNTNCGKDSVQSTSLLR
jgi:hypothetical protein